jgi:uncharacterized protein (DUF362 family)/Pyruvate/2-oxoacid:ferredoxin oxidoreductase delta subunit
LLRDRANRIVIGDSSAFYQGGHTERGFRTSGIEKIAARYGAELIAFEKGPLHLVHNEGSSSLGDILLSAIPKEVDWIINVPKLKTHAFFQMSGAVKNLFGFVPGGAKYEYHFAGESGRESFARKLADIWLAIRPNLSIMDAIWGLEGFGPAATGTPRHAGLLLAGENPWAVDWIAARCMGFEPGFLAGCREGLERGYLSSPEDIALLGDFTEVPAGSWKPAPSGAEKPKEENGFYWLVAVHPALRARRCTGCGLCPPSCPVGAIAMGANRRPVIDLDRCLRCHHCVYACPEGALFLKGESPLNLPARALRKLLRL